MEPAWRNLNIWNICVTSFIPVITGLPRLLRRSVLLFLHFFRETHCTYRNPRTSLVMSSADALSVAKSDSSDKKESAAARKKKDRQSKRQATQAVKDQTKAEAIQELEDASADDPDGDAQVSQFSGSAGSVPASSSSSSAIGSSTSICSSFGGTLIKSDESVSLNRSNTNTQIMDPVLAELRNLSTAFNNLASNQSQMTSRMAVLEKSLTTNSDNKHAVNTVPSNSINLSGTGAVASLAQLPVATTVASPGTYPGKQGYSGITRCCGIVGGEVAFPCCDRAEEPPQRRYL